MSPMRRFVVGELASFHEQVVENAFLAKPIICTSDKLVDYVSTVASLGRSQP